MMLNISQNKLTIVSCEWLLENLNLEHLVILDASVKKVSVEAALSSEDYIPNSRCFDIKRKFSDAAATFPNTIPSEAQFQYEARQLRINKDSLIVVYDDKGMYWSPRVWWLFNTFGFENIAVLDGGLPEWKKLNYATVSAMFDQTEEIGGFIANYQSDNMRYFHHILDIAKNEQCVILDARSEDRFNETEPEPRTGVRKGTIPNSANLPYKYLMDGNCLKSKPELKKIFDTFEIGDRSLTFSCGTGITACILALAAEILNYKNLSVYDGSWTEFGTLTT